VFAGNALALLLTSIAAISLVVGGIGVMNVMLVSVTERTREIGLRLAVGATGRWVQVQFLGEAVLLSLLGGVAGIALGIVASLVLGRVLDWRMSIPPEALLLAPLCATAVGVFFGFYPARRAARLDPTSARAQLLLGTTYHSLGRIRDAVKAYRRYLELEPTSEFAKDVQVILANLGPPG